MFYFWSRIYYDAYVWLMRKIIFSIIDLVFHGGAADDADDGDTRFLCN